MKSIFKKLTSLMLVAVMVCGIFGSVPASAASISYKKNVTVYMSGNASDGQFAVANLEVKNISAKLTSVKSSNDNIVHVVQSSYSKKNKTGTISIWGMKSGTAKVTFKVKGKSKKYTINVTVKKYTNPVSTLKITGVSSGKNVASKLKKDGFYAKSSSLKKNYSNAKLTVKAKSGWTLKNVSVENNKTGKTILNKKVNTTKKKTYSLGTLQKGKSYWISLTFRNNKTKGDLTVEFTF